jgi:hypothetical protein
MRSGRLVTDISKSNRVQPYKQVEKQSHDSQKREESLEKVTNVFMEQYTLPTHTSTHSTRRKEVSSGSDEQVGQCGYDQ